MAHGPGEIWALDQTYTNYLLAQQKLVHKQRHGAKVTKRHDRAATPFARADARSELTETSRKAMQRTMQTIHPGDLFRQIRPAIHW